MKELYKHLRRLVLFSVASAVIYSSRFYRIYRDFWEKRLVSVFTYQRDISLPYPCFFLNLVCFGIWCFVQLDIAVMLKIPFQHNKSTYSSPEVILWILQQGRNKERIKFKVVSLTKMLNMKTTWCKQNIAFSIVVKLMKFILPYGSSVVYSDYCVLFSIRVQITAQRKINLPHNCSKSEAPRFSPGLVKFPAKIKSLV